MALTKIDQVDYTAMGDIDQTGDSATDFRRAIESAEQDAPGTRYYPDWSKWFGYYKVIPDAASIYPIHLRCLPDNVP